MCKAYEGTQELPGGKGGATEDEGRGRTKGKKEGWKGAKGNVSCDSSGDFTRRKAARESSIEFCEPSQSASVTIVLLLGTVGVRMGRVP